ncbi:MAG TPA: diguanylate cyclase, partial [Stenomitos sp.]
MLKSASRQTSSIRNRLILGVSLMLVPLMAIAVGSYLGFEQAVGTFERSENKRLEELFPLDRLELVLREAAELTEPVNRDGSIEKQIKFARLSQEIDQIFISLLNSPSQLQEKRALVLDIQQKWHHIKQEEERYLGQPFSLSVAEVRTYQTELDRQFDGIVRDIRRLNNLLVSFQTNDNLRQVNIIKQQVRALTILTALVAVVIAVSAISFLARSILKPLRYLNQGVSRFGDGDLSSRIHLQTKDELEQLAHTFNWMADNLEQSQRELMELATIDGLTGVLNRREFNRRLTQELERSRRGNYSVSLLMIDIDHFKKLNDTYGHQSGDDALRHVSWLIRREVRPGDLPARYGGEEFAVILPHADTEDAFIVAERLRNLIASEKVPI